MKKFTITGLVWLFLAITACTIKADLPDLSDLIGDAGMSYVSDEGLYNPDAIGQTSAGGLLTTGDPSRQVSVQCGFKKAGVVTVQFNLSTVTPVAAITIRAEAFIEFSVGGQSVTRRISIGDGSSISGTAEMVRVVMTDTTDLTASPSNLGRDYQVSVQIAPGTRPDTSIPPTLLTSPGGPPDAVTILSGNSLLVPVPADAGVSSVEVTVATVLAGPLLEQAVNVAHVTNNGSTTLKQYDPRAFAFVPVANGTQYILLLNNSAVDVLMQVTFGIDG